MIGAEKGGHLENLSCCQNNERAITYRMRMELKSACKSILNEGYERVKADS